MSLKVSIDHGGRQSVVVEKDRGKRSKDRSSSRRSERDLREVISREVRGVGDLRDRLEQVRGQIAEHEEQQKGATKDDCEMSDFSSQHKLSLYSDEKSSDSKGKENSKDDTSEPAKAGKEKTLTTEWSQRKKKKKKRSRSRSKERKPLADNDSENRKRKHSDEAEAKDGTKSKKEKRRSVSRDNDDRKKKKDKKKEKKRSRSGEPRPRSPAGGRRGREGEGRKSRVDSGISSATNFSGEPSPRDPLASPRRLPAMVGSRGEPSLSPSPSPPRRVLVRAGEAEGEEGEEGGAWPALPDVEEQGGAAGEEGAVGAMEGSQARGDEVTDGKKSPDKNRKGSQESHESHKSHEKDTKEKRSSHEKDTKERRSSHEKDTKDRKGSYEKDAKDRKGSHEKDAKDRKESHEKDGKERKESHENDTKERKESHEKDGKERKGSQEKERRRSQEREGRNPYSVYDEKHTPRPRTTRSRPSRRDRSRSRGDLKDEVERLRREARDGRPRRSRSRSRRGRRSEEVFRPRGAREAGGRYNRVDSRYSGGVRRSCDQQDSWEDKVESFLQNTSSNSLSMVQLLPQDFDPSKPPPMAAVVVPPDYALTEYSDPVLASHEAAPAIRQLTDVTTGQIIPQTGVPAGGLPDLYTQPPPYVTSPLDYPPPAQLSHPPPHYVQTDVTTFAKEAQVHPLGLPPPEPFRAEAMELAAMNQLNDENAKLRKETDKPLTVKEKKKQEKAQKELWQFLAKKLISDPVFCLKAKKKKSKSSEELKEKAEKCAVRLALTLEKAGFSEARLWDMLKKNEKGVQGFSAELSSAVMNGTVEADVTARSPKHRLDAELLKDGAVFRYIGQYIQGNPGNSGRKSATPPESADLPSTNELQSILALSQAAPEAVSALPAPASLHPFQKADHETDWDFSNRSFGPLEAYLVGQHVAKPVAEAYCLTLVRANFNYPRLRDTVVNFRPQPAENEGEPPETLYGHLLGCLREISFEHYPSIITDGIDHHTVTIVKLLLDHFEQQPASPPAAAARPPQTEVPPPGANTGPQLPRKKYVTMAVSVETVPVEGRLAVWQICLHTPGLPEEQDPDYECLMVPGGVPEGRLLEAGFMYNQEKAAWYHQGTEFGRRKAETEEKSIEKLVNYLEELRGGGRQAGLNNGLVLLFECTEDFGLVRSLLSGHSADIWSDTVKGVGCIDHFVRQADIQAAYCPPYFKYAVGEEGQWITTLHRRGKALKIDAASRGEMVYNILEDVLDQCPTYDTFLRWYCYPSQGDTAATLARDLELGRHLLPLQTHVDRQLFNARVQCVLEGVYAPRGELESRQPCACVARQAVRRLVSLGFNLDNLKNSFRADPNYEIPANVFLQDMTQVQRLRVHTQTDFVRKFIKEYFTPNFYR